MKKNKIDVIWGEATITKPGEVSVGKPKKQPMQPQIPRRKARSARARIKQSTSSSRPARGRACCPASSPTAS